MDNFKVAICDDNKYELEDIRSLCIRILDTQSVTYSLVLFNSGKEFLSTEEVFDLILLDVEMAEVNGISVKNQLQECSMPTKIIFISNYQDKVLDAFGSNVVAYIDKKHLGNLAYVVKRVISDWQDKEVLVLDHKHELLKDLVYIEGDGSYSVLHFVANREVIQRQTLKYYDELLQHKGFLRIQKSYIINLRYVTFVSNTYVELENRCKLTISRGSQDTIKDAHFKYVKEHRS